MTLRTILNFCLLIGLVSLVSGQGGNDRSDLKSIPPELLVKIRQAGEARDRGKALMKEGKLEEAIAAFRASIVIEQTIPGHASGGQYELAKALTATGQTEEALGAYKKAIRWREDWKGLHISGPPFPYVHLDYALLLAKNGKLDEAKMLYYDALRIYPGNRHNEPFPFLIVFDPDSTMTEWAYTQDNLILAISMFRASFSQSEDVERSKQVREMAPNWVVPVVYLAHRGKRSELLSVAQGLAVTEEERAWVRQYTDAIAQGGDIEEINQRVRDVASALAAIGVARRKSSTVLAQAKLDLEQNWHKIASPPSVAGVARAGGGSSNCFRGRWLWIGASHGWPVMAQGPSLGTRTNWEG